MTWIASNIATLAVCVILAAVVILIVASMVRRKKRGKTICGCSCADCPMSDKCGGKENGDS